MGRSSDAIMYGHGRDYPRGPADLLRCISYCERSCISSTDLRDRMAGKSVEWDRLTEHWDELVSLLDHEIETRTDGMAPATYLAMKRIIAGGDTCLSCDGSGRGVECEKCKGSGRRSGGKCRAQGCYRGAAFCATCRGRGYVGGDR